MQSKKKILICGKSLSIGGVEKALLALVNSFDYSQYDVELYLLEHDDELVEFVNKEVLVSYFPDDLQWILLPKGHVFKSISHLFRYPKRLFVFFVNLFRGLLNRNMAVSRQRMWRDCIKYIPSKTQHYSAALDFSGLMRRFVLYNVSADFKYTWIHSDYRVFMYDKSIDFKLLSQFDKIFCVSKTCKQIFDSEFPSLSTKSDILLNMIDLSFIQSQIKVGHGFNDFYKGKRLLDITRLDPNKGLDIAVRVCASLKREGLDFRWYILGSDPLGYKKKLEQLISEYDVKDFFILLGLKRNPYPYINEADLIVHFSRFEGRSVAIDEALALHKKILLTNYPTAKDQIIDGVNGYICDFDEKHLVSKLKDLIIS